MLKRIGGDAARPVHSSDNGVRTSGAPPGRSDVEVNKKCQQIIGRAAGGSRAAQNGALPQRVQRWARGPLNVFTLHNRRFQLDLFLGMV